MSHPTAIRPAAPRWLPRGGALPAADWDSRHRLILAILAVHLPVVLFFGLATGHGWVSALDLVPIAALLAVGASPLSRRVRTLAASLGLLSCSAILVHLANGAAVMHFHYFITVALSAIYEDWLTYLMAFAFVLFEHAVVGTLLPTAVYGAPVAHPWLTALVHATFVFAVSVAQLVFWRYAEQSRAREASYRLELADGQRSVQNELQRIIRTREDLLGTVTHEFRTPLTAIRGAALTLRKHRGRLQPAQTDTILDALITNADRLSRLLENMLTAAEARKPDHAAVANVYQVAVEAAMLVRAAHAERAPDVAVAIDPQLEASVERSALHQILANLLDNAILHAAPRSQAIISAGPEDGDIVITIANEAHGVDAQTLERLFEPFTLADASVTRPKQGAGVGLYVVRRLVEVSSGLLRVHSEPGWVSVEVRLPTADRRQEIELPADEPMRMPAVS